ncbi:MAG TPA: DNA-binding domain-containing protein [Candidatus Angelobacter sp.]|nr:DNA-binding domain-containing protein [Candidatus Angelobacter sp.]
MNQSGVSMPGGLNQPSRLNLEDLQREVFSVIRQPLTASEDMNPTLPDGTPTQAVADKIIKPNDRLTSFERLEIYNRQYWYRILSSLADDFPGLRAILGDRQFEKLSVAYLAECPSESFTMRNLGSKLESWLLEHLEFVTGVERIAMDMVRLEWADIAAFDDPELPVLKPEDLSTLGDDPVFHIQPHLRLLDLSFPVDDLLLSVRKKEQDKEVASNAVMERSHRSRIRRSSLPKPKKTRLAVYRRNESIYFKVLEPEAFALVRALQQGKTLSEAIEASVNWTNRSVEHITKQLHGWFANWASLGWFGKLPAR